MAGGAPCRIISRVRLEVTLKVVTVEHSDGGGAFDGWTTRDGWSLEMILTVGAVRSLETLEAVAERAKPMIGGEVGKEGGRCFVANSVRSLRI